MTLMTNNEWKSLILSVGKSHLEPRPASPLEVAKLIQKARDSGLSSEEISEKCHFGVSMITKFTNLLKVTEEYWHLIDWGENEGLISPTGAQAVAEYDEKVQKVILAATLKHGFNKDEISFLGQRLKKSGMTEEECIVESVNRRHGAPILFWLIMGSFSQSAQNIFTNLSQLERDNILKEFFNKNYPEKKIVAKAKLIGFSLVIRDKELFNELNPQKETIESKINEFICQTK